MDVSSNDTTKTALQIEAWKFGQIFAITIGLLMIVFSVISIVALSKCKSMNKRVCVLAQLLSISNITLGFSLMLTVAVNTSRLRHTSVVCYVSFCVSRTSLLLNIFLITMLALDRVLCIYFPLKYLNIVTKRLIIHVFACQWILACILSIVSIPESMDNCAAPYQGEGGGIIVISYFLCIFIIILAYIGIFKTIHKHHAHMRSLHLPLISDGRIFYRSTATFTFIILTFILCYTPAGMYRAYLYFNPGDSVYNDTSGMRSTFNILYSCNSVFNLLIYVWIFPECRLQMMKILCLKNSEMVLRMNEQVKIITAPYLDKDLQVTIDASITTIYA